MILINLEPQIFRKCPTFHGTSVGNHDLKIIDGTNVTFDFLGNEAMNKIMGATTVNKDDDFLMLNISNELEGLWRREDNEGMQ
jgi:hypothetical protein